ncbi:hypothetical protein KQX54_013303 [Cotesia glomerata]|uniref:Uncharacterized protein n=1 Tax=Cotesia glomerata TaxID=32391 RepID=A0AAV7HXF4_COTGL|nr:hypothetical protein KQX54_013303 [Cotesia glomerata]
MAIMLTFFTIRVLLKKSIKSLLVRELMSPDVLKQVEATSVIYDNIKTAEANISDGKLMSLAVLKHTESPSIVQDTVDTENCKSSPDLTLANHKNSLKDRNLGQDSCDVTFEEYSSGNMGQDIELKAQDSQFTTAHTDEYNTTLDNNEISLMEISPDSQSQNSSCTTSIHKAINSRNVQPKIVSDLSGIFISKNGSTKIPHYISADFDNMPIFIINAPIDQLKTSDQVADISLTAIEHATSLTALGHSNFLGEDSYEETELNSVETSSTMEPSLKQLTMYSVDSDEIIRDSIGSTDYDVNNSFLSVELHAGNNLPELRNSNYEKDDLNDTGLSIPTLTDQSRLSSSTLNNTKDESSYVLPPDTSLDQSSELCTNIEDETTENLEDTEDNESVIEELIKSRSHQNLMIWKFQELVKKQRNPSAVLLSFFRSH